MIKEKHIKSILEKGIMCGAEFVELFFENTIKNTIKMENLNVESVKTIKNNGVGIRVYKGVEQVYAYTDKINVNELINIVSECASMLDGINNHSKFQKSLVKARGHMQLGKIISVSSPINKKLSLMRDASKGILSRKILGIEAKVKFYEEDQNVIIANSEGRFIEDRRTRNKIIMVSRVNNDKRIEMAHDTIVGRGLEVYDKVNLFDAGKKISKIAINKIDAKKINKKKIPVIIDKGAGGILIHEACGHLIESRNIVNKDSIFIDKLGEKIATDKVTVIDDGRSGVGWGSAEFDDEGNKTRKNILVEKGVLKKYLVDKISGQALNLKANGCSRRESYKFPPTSRMANTYLESGNDSEKEMLKSIYDGVLIKKTGSGRVDIGSGNFRFDIEEAYVLKNGQICEMIKDTQIIGNSSNILSKIEMVGKEVGFDNGSCGACSGEIHTSSGQPMIKISEMTICPKNRF